VHASRWEVLDPGREVFSLKFKPAMKVDVVFIWSHILRNVHQVLPIMNCEFIDFGELHGTFPILTDAGLNLPEQWTINKQINEQAMHPQSYWGATKNKKIQPWTDNYMSGWLSAKEILTMRGNKAITQFCFPTFLYPCYSRKQSSRQSHISQMYKMWEDCGGAKCKQSATP
jgi:hypothetical protein